MHTKELRPIRAVKEPRPAPGAEMRLRQEKGPAGFDREAGASQHGRGRPCHTQLCSPFRPEGPGDSHMAPFCPHPTFG